MSEAPSLLPPENGDLHDFVVTYLANGGAERTHTLKSKAAPNALASFARAVPRHGRILGIRKVVP